MFPTGSSTSSTERPEGRRRARRATVGAASGAAALLLHACGFAPTHAPDGAASPAELAGFEIAHIPDRTGQLLRHELERRFRPRLGEARHVVSVRVAQRIENLGIRVDETATRSDLILTANFVVREKATGLVKFGGAVRSVAGYNILKSDFATVHARSKARRQAVDQIADDLFRRVSVWLLQKARAGRP